ncbi:MAG: NAD-dependent epimerase/dehydratase family protein [Treponema sp.]|nr:NAD-dependent epimerase/dehydratase family protein [Treponema sp.]
MNSLSNSKLYCSDINNILDNYSFFKNLQNKSLFITGCNGLICSAVVDMLLLAEKKYSLNLKIYLATRNIEKTKNRFGIEDNSFVKCIPYDANKPLIFDETVDFYIHGASPASPELFVKNPVDTMLSNILGLKEILDKAKNNARVLYVSSSEVYGKIQTAEPIPEDACGPIDILNPRSSYGQSKRAAETLCASYKAQFNSDVVIVRPGHIYGPTASRSDNRVSSSFMYDAFDGKDLVLKSKGEQLRSYTNCIDCASAILTVLLKGESGQAYNISNPDSICSIADMAKSFAKYSGVNLRFELPAEEEKKAFNPMNNSSLNSKKLEALGWKPCLTKDEGFEHSIKILKEIQ